MCNYIVILERKIIERNGVIYVMNLVYVLLVLLVNIVLSHILNDKINITDGDIS